MSPKTGKPEKHNPLASLYLAGLRMDRYFTEALQLPAPVVSVGNISVGGRGKTPFVIEICKKLKREGYSPAVLTRGYGRSTRRQCFIDLDRNIRDWDVQCGGDEALEIAYFARVPVLVGPRRADNAQKYLAENPDQRGIVFVLDDGFQHWKIKRDFDLVLVAAQDYHDQLLPLGRLREPVSALSRANLVWEDGRDFRKETAIAYRGPVEGKIYFLSTRAPSPSYAEELRRFYPQILGLVLPDHAREARIKASVERSNADVLVVGAKEAVKMFSLEDFDELVREGLLRTRYAGRPRTFLFARCDLKLSDPEKLWEPLRHKLLRIAQRSDEGLER